MLVRWTRDNGEAALRRSARRIAIDLAIVLVCAAAAFVFLAWRPTIDAVATPARTAFAPEVVRHGMALAAGGFCGECHTVPGGKPLAGGRPLATPFGTIYGSNITPDRDTGIGTWSAEAFRRAMRDGVDREGRHLYPAFPYNHFTGLTDGDIDGLYAYLMTREPVRAATPAPDLPFPYNIRALLAGWNLLFLREGPLTPDANHTAEWNRGAYLSEALAHCGACHTPRNQLGAEIASRHYGGGEAEDWWAPPLDASSPAPLPWTSENLFNYLRSWDSDHGGAVGPMKPVMQGLAQLPASDVRAIAVYVADSLGLAHGDRAKTKAIAERADASGTDPALARGKAVFVGACASCHESGASVPFTVRSLAQHTTVAGPDPRNVIQVVLNGVQPREGEVGAIMPAFAGTLTEQQIADLLAYLRARFTDAPAWPGVPEQIHRLAAGAGRP